MSSDLQSEPRVGSADTGPILTSFQHEVRREGHIVATLQARETGSSFAVETVVFPVTRPAGAPGLTRPFAFASLEHARRFVDEALVAFEYLGCSVA